MNRVGLRCVIRTVVPVVMALGLTTGDSLASADHKSTRVTGTHASVIVPSGFEKAQNFPGFQDPESGSSIVVTEMPAPFEEVRKGMTKQGLASNGMTLLSTEPTRIANMEALLVSVSQVAQETNFRKWIGAFGDKSTTVMVVATFPETSADELADPLKRAVLSATWSSKGEMNTFEGLSFRIRETTSLKVSSRISNNVALTKGGKPLPVAPADPYIVVGSSFNEVDITDLEEFSRVRLMQTATIEDIQNVAGSPITVAGVPAYEVTATAKDSESKTPIMVYQVVVPKDGLYYLIQGMVGSSAAEKYLPEFREVTRSFSLAD